MKPYIVEPFPGEFRVIKLSERAHESLQNFGAPIPSLALISMFPSLEQQGDAELDERTFASLAEAQSEFPDAEIPGLTRWFPAPFDLPGADQGSPTEAEDGKHKHPEPAVTS